MSDSQKVNGLPQVRIALPEDEDDLVAMCHRLWAENGLFSLNEKKVRDCIQRCYRREGTIVAVVGDTGHIEASLCMAISDFYYTDDWHLAELWNFVDEPYRRSYNAEALIEFAKSCSDKMNMPFFTGIITNKRMAGKVNLYRRLFGYPTGAFFLYNGKWKTDPMEDHTVLRDRLKEFAVKCNDGKVSTGIARKALGPLLREAADAIAGEDSIWGGAKRNGAQAHANGRN